MGTAHDSRVQELQTGGESMMGKSGAVRLRGLRREGLIGAERHGKRFDETGRARQVRDAPALAWVLGMEQATTDGNGLEICRAWERHADGVQMSRGTRRIAGHALLQWPTELNLARHGEGKMLLDSMMFINEYFGRRAVFAARLDRDEAGRHSVDVFYLPKYTFKYKDGSTTMKASLTRFLKARAIERLGSAAPRDQGRALQQAWHEHLRDSVGLDWVVPPTPKPRRGPDRLEPEAYKVRQDRARLEADRRALDAREKEVTATVERMAASAERNRARVERREKAAMEVARKAFETEDRARDLIAAGRAWPEKAVALWTQPHGVTLSEEEREILDGPATGWPESCWTRLRHMAAREWGSLRKMVAARLPVEPPPGGRGPTGPGGT